MDDVGFNSPSSIRKIAAQCCVKLLRIKCLLPSVRASKLGAPCRQIILTTERCYYDPSEAFYAVGNFMRHWGAIFLGSWEGHWGHLSWAIFFKNVKQEWVSSKLLSYQKKNKRARTKGFQDLWITRIQERSAGRIEKNPRNPKIPKIRVLSRRLTSLRKSWTHKWNPNIKSMINLA